MAYEKEGEPDNAVWAWYWASKDYARQYAARKARELRERAAKEQRRQPEIQSLDTDPGDVV